MKKLTSIILLYVLIIFSAENSYSRETERHFVADSLESNPEILEKLMNMPNIEVGKGVTFRPKNDSYELTLRFRMQNMVGLSFGDRLQLNQTDAQVKRLRLRFDGYLFSPRFVYSIQLGFTGYDAKTSPNGTTNIVRDAIVYYKPNSYWNFGFGQTKLKTNRARVNSSSALQFVDRSIVNSEFGGDRDFGFFGEYYYGDPGEFSLTALASVTLGEGRNWGSSDISGLAYTGRVEIFPFGRFKSKGHYVEGDTYFEENLKLMMGGGYSFNHNAKLNQGFKGDAFPTGVTKNIGAYYADLVLKYRGFAFNADYMGRHANNPSSVAYEDCFIYTGSGLNAQASYLFDGKWEIAARNSLLMPERKVQPLAGYRLWNQSTIGVTRYIIGHSLKVQVDISYNYMAAPVLSTYDRLGIRFQVELGL